MPYNRTRFTKSVKLVAHIGTGVAARRLAVAVVLLAAGRVGGDPVTLDNGVPGDGHLQVTVDDYGTVAEAFGGGPQWPDLFNPSPDPTEGELGEDFPTFASFILYFVDPSTVGEGTHRGIATSHAGLLGTFNDGNVICTVVSPNTTDQLPAATSSVFACAGDGVDIVVQLSQSVGVLPDGPGGARRALLDQTYDVQNAAAAELELITVKHTDVDMPWGGGAPFHLDDLVGMDDAELGRPQVYAMDRELITATLALRTGEDTTQDPHSVDFVYYCGKQNLPAPPGNPDYPGGACPAHDYGTDLQIWDNYGVPNCWKNFVPGVGYNVPGISPQVSGESLLGLQVEFLLAPGDSSAVSFQTVYGALGEAPPLEIVHEDGLSGQTRPLTGYIDPRSEVAFPPLEPVPVGLTEAFLRFTDDVWSCDGSAAGPDNFVMTETGSQEPPTVVSAEYVDPNDRTHVRVQWDRPITLLEWTTLRAQVCNASGVPIETLGDLGPGVQEPDRVDLAFLPCDVNQDGNVSPFDLLDFRGLINQVYPPWAGTLEDQTDLDRSGATTPIDLLRFRQLVNGVPPATRAWNGEELLHPQP